MQSPELRNAAIFYLIVLALAAGLALAAPGLGGVTPLLTMLTPALGALVMLFVVAPEGGWRQAPGRLGLDRAGLKGWPLAIGAPVLIHLIGLAVLGLTGLALFALPQAQGGLAQTVVKFVIGLGISTLLALCEEIGWRGYLLPRMLGIGLVPALLLVGFLHGVWHLPVMLGTDYYHSTGNPWLVVPLFLITLTLAGVFYGFLRIWTGSVWPVALAHAATNEVWAAVDGATQTRSPLVQEYLGGESGVIVIAALVVLSVVLIRVMRRAGFDAGAKP